MEKRYRLELIGITYNQIESGVYALVLQQVGTTRRIPIIIGYPEAQAIECKLQDIDPPRPLMHDTMAKTMEAFGLRLMEVEIKKLPNGVFSADLHFTDGKERRIIDSRSSDAVALAIRVGAPIYTSESVLLEAGFENNDIKKQKAQSSSANAKTNVVPSSLELKDMTVEQLNEKMQQAVMNEEYEEAAKIKAEIDNRNAIQDKI